MTILNLLSCERGATAIEYGLIAAGIGLAIVTSVFAFGDDLSGLYAGLSAVTGNE